MRTLFNYAITFRYTKRRRFKKRANSREGFKAGLWANYPCDGVPSTFLLIPNNISFPLKSRTKQSATMASKLSLFSSTLSLIHPEISPHSSKLSVQLPNSQNFQSFTATKPRRTEGMSYYFLILSLFSVLCSEVWVISLCFRRMADLCYCSWSGGWGWSWSWRWSWSCRGVHDNAICW